MSWQAGVKGQAGDRGQTAVRLSWGVITGTWLLMVDVAGDVPICKTKHLLFRLLFQI